MFSLGREVATLNGANSLTSRIMLTLSFGECRGPGSSSGATGAGNNDRPYRWHHRSEERSLTTQPTPGVRAPLCH